MSFNSANLTPLGYGNGFSLYRYDTTDLETGGATPFEAAGYFNNKDDDLRLAVGDIIFVMSWNTAVRTGTMEWEAKLDWPKKCECTASPPSPQRAVEPSSRLPPKHSGMARSQ